MVGEIDPSQAPAVAVGTRGNAVLGWIEAGHVFAAVRRRGSGRFGGAVEVSATTVDRLRERTA